MLALVGVLGCEDCVVGAADVEFGFAVGALSTRWAGDCVEQEIIVENKWVLRFEENGILQLLWDHGASIVEEDARSVIESITRVSGGQRRGLLVDMRGINSISYGARTVFGTARSASAVALVGSPSPVDRVLTAFFLGIGRSSSYSRFFTSATAARDWLQSSSANDSVGGPSLLPVGKREGIEVVWPLPASADDFPGASVTAH